MHLELSALIELQRLDKEILALQKQIDNIPSKISQVEKPLLQAQVRIDSQKKSQEEFLKKKKEKEFQLDDISEKINKLKARSSEVKTNKEYQAHLKEIESFENEKIRIEDELLVLMERSDEMVRDLKNVESTFSAEENKVNQLKETLKGESQQIENQLKDLKLQRNTIAEKMSRETYEEYMGLLEAGQGIAVAEVNNEVCQGCSMNIPPQLYVEVRKGDERYNCPQCGRFLYFVDRKKEE